MAARGTRAAAAASTTNPFGIADATYREMRRRPHVRQALALYESGRTNRDGGVLPPARSWRRAVARSTEWGDLRLALRVLRETGARPLVWTLPLAGSFYDFTAVSAPVRRTYYARYARTGERAGVVWLDFRAHDEDRYFVTDPGSHLSARGWVFADRALDVFWHGGTTDGIRVTLAALAREAPVPDAAPTAGARASD
jgi:poly-D-alanine transfer protein DltD